MGVGEGSAICGGAAGDGSAIAVVSRLQVLEKFNCLASGYSSRCRSDADALCEGGVRELVQG
jgi:hypothetical protein